VKTLVVDSLKNASSESTETPSIDSLQSVSSQSTKSLSIDSLDALLPQTQCQRCGFQGCRPYAEAMLQGTPHNQCPPGGERVIQALSQALSRPIIPLNPTHGQEGPRYLARIREADCIGCTKCLQACPVDAIVGASKQLHTVIASACTGCGLCVPTCPVDCIEWEISPVQPETLSAEARKALEAQYRRDHQRHLARQSGPASDEPLKTADSTTLTHVALSCLDDILGSSGTLF
jgi:electron transport complex protein RnfB